MSTVTYTMTETETATWDGPDDRARDELKAELRQRHSKDSGDVEIETADGIAWFVVDGSGWVIGLLDMDDDDMDDGDPGSCVSAAVTALESTDDMDDDDMISLLDDMVEAGEIEGGQ